ncbi:bifunctional hydroxymethylpyrimidine kinase/phosphomethylpyrimidine kinase [Fodinibius sediminis]|jgi:hydroxymethylpyrimidine/phosphomethylpyrimidine kinase|uniref:hydroxymethylpyrimidine kinase n=1 Tax=Fodinibius sediminis TaxID=1214077 RepID=A0A521EQH6_9BACT|nr:bifunctional hydroxymethylpyrimidine kinase/phosphomethylpyrimidine kinase [Fodinibius sediminis]SMO86184.1 hydroxymethylpyrimidine/phosphomethylpyrimidine kinase [Fodinibius sediminis]
MNSVSENTVPTALTIAGSDPSGGAGLQADLKTFSHYGIYGMTAITCLTAGNTQGVSEVNPIDPSFIRQQCQSVIQDIKPSVTKTGMLFSKETIVAVADDLATISCPIVVDPVMVTKRGDILLSKNAQNYYIEHLLQLSDVLTPNIPEAELLTKEQINNSDDMEQAAKRLLEMGSKSVVIKGGHQKESKNSNDLFFDGNEMIWLTSKRYPTQHTHGAGDAFSAAISALLAKGKSLRQAAEQAKQFIIHAIKSAPGLGKGQGPINFSLSHHPK